MKTLLKATDGHTALLRNGEVAVIGHIHELGYKMSKEGELVKATMVVLDFENNGNRDYWFFENGDLVYHHLSDSPDKEVRKLYEDVVKAKNCTLNSFLVTISHGYAAAMVFGPLDS